MADEIVPPPSKWIGPIVWVMNHWRRCFPVIGVYVSSAVWDFSEESGEIEADVSGEALPAASLAVWPG